jgi:hypothetical protein
VDGVTVVDVVVEVDVVVVVEVVEVDVVVEVEVVEPGGPVVVVVTDGAVDGAGSRKAHMATAQSAGVEAWTTRIPGNDEYDHTCTGGPVWRQASAGSVVPIPVSTPTT